MDSREAEERQLIADATAAGRCPWSGLVLHMEGEGWPGMASCDMCDCFGFNPEEVKVLPRPLNVVRWKVTRRRCMECGRSYADSTKSSICYRCLEDAIGPLDLSPFAPF